MARNGSFGCSEAETEAGDTGRVGEDNYIGLFGGALKIALEEGALEEGALEEGALVERGLVASASIEHDRGV